MYVILATQEAEIMRIEFPSHPQAEFERPYLGKNLSQKRTGEVAQGVGPEFKPQYCKNTKNFFDYDIS
jgi:hypothetical protein